MSGANVKNAADKEQVKKGGKLEKEQRNRELLDIRNVMQTESGRRLLFRILHNFCHIDLRSADPRSGSWTYFNEGARDVGMAIKNDMLEGAFHEFQQMEKEWAIAKELIKLEQDEPEGKE